MYKENLGANCGNCNNKDREDKRRCRLCATKENRAGWEPAPGIRVRTYELFLGPRLIPARGREVIGGI